MSEKRKHGLNPEMNEAYPLVVRGEGIYLYDEDGKRYIDGAGGSIVVSLGHGLKEFGEVIKQQVEKVAFCSRKLFSSPQFIELAAKICELTNFEMDKIFLVSGGSEATESSVKLARKYHIDRGTPSKYKIISRWQSYHGSTMGALSWTGFTFRRKDYLPYLADGVHIPPAYCYRCWFHKEPETCDLECANALEYAINQEEANTVSAFIAEPVVGAALCGAVPRDGYFKRIREICDHYDVLLILDEVMTGFGRTGKNFGYEHFGIIPDIAAIAKGLSGGYYPLGGVMCRPKVTDGIAAKSGLFAAGHTYSGNPVGAAVGIKAIDYLKEHDLVNRCARMGQYLAFKMESLREHPTVGDTRGKGLMMGVEFVKKKETKESIDPGFSYSTQIRKEALKQGLTLLAATGCNNGTEGDQILLGPPFIITEEQIDEMIDILDNTISVVERRNGFR